MTLDEAQKLDNSNTIVVANNRKYDFGYIAGKDGNRIVVYIRGECNMQDSYSFPIDEVSIATEEDIKNLYWGI